MCVIDTYIALIYYVAMDTKNDKWHTQLRKGTFELAILLLLKNDAMYGYQITKKLQEDSSFPIADGSIYPILRRMSANGWISSFKEEHEGRSRKYYYLTDAGKEISEDRWNEFLTVYSFLNNLQAGGE
ncbi:transcriptional regulator, PadR family [Halobacillus alkaliphilus]|uniref:Transcriptional regulator, PadR family n=2 Tax=Halobacillus TaxID=45667 RepID=A0A1I2JU55_9BACI|nr:PadR family transcriptional regulator [Halobacillus alkaliphilus]SFF57450.1 transcriptional regulator, PadR family [Halobacillus alkaliphilus]